MLKPLLMIAWREARGLRLAFALGGLALLLGVGIDLSLYSDSSSADSGRIAALWSRGAGCVFAVLFLIAEEMKGNVSLRFPSHYSLMPVRTWILASAVFLVRLLFYAAFVSACFYLANALFQPQERAQFRDHNLVNAFLTLSPMAPISAFSLQLGLCWLPRKSALMIGAGLAVAWTTGAPFPPAAVAIPLGLALGVWGAVRSRAGSESCWRGRIAWPQTRGRMREFASPTAAQRWLECQRVLRGTGVVWLYGVPLLLFAIAEVFLGLREITPANRMGTEALAAFVGCLLFAPLGLVGAFAATDRVTRSFGVQRPASDWMLGRSRLEASALLCLVWTPLAAILVFRFLPDSIQEGAESVWLTAAMGFIVVACLLWAGSWGAFYPVLGVLALASVSAYSLSVETAHSALVVSVLAFLLFYSVARRRGAMTGGAEIAMWTVMLLTFGVGLADYLTTPKNASLWPMTFLSFYLTFPFVFVPFDTHLRRHR